jgi:hypothetical protein
MKQLHEVLSDVDKGYISLIKFTGKPIKDILGYVSSGFDVPVFKISQFVFEGGETIFVQGEHDIAYIPCDDNSDTFNEVNLSLFVDE